MPKSFPRFSVAASIFLEMNLRPEIVISTNSVWRVPSVPCRVLQTYKANLINIAIALWGWQMSDVMPLDGTCSFFSSWIWDDEGRVAKWSQVCHMGQIRDVGPDRLEMWVWLWCDMIWYDMIWYDMIWYHMVSYDMDMCILRSLHLPVLISLF